jgi:hypothetical protein
MTGKKRQLIGWILVAIGGVFLLGNLHIDAVRYILPGLLIILGVYLVYRTVNRKSRSDWSCGDVEIVSDSKTSGFAGEIDGTTISHFIGDVDLDLAGAHLKPGENHLKISAFIADIRLKVPASVPVRVASSAFAGDFDVLGQGKDGIFLSFKTQTPDYDTAQTKLSITCSVFIGDIKIRRP